MANEKREAPAIDKITSHFKAKLDNELKKIHVPEWDIDIYYGPETCEARDSYMHLLIDKRFEGYVNILIKRALYADGRRMFREADRISIMKEADPKIVSRIGSEIFNDDDEERVLPQAAAKS